MSVSASIKFTQGMSSPAPGIALIGVAAVPVVVTNGDNSNVLSWTWTVGDRPPTSTVPLGVIAAGSVPTVSFTPDVAGGYLIELSVVDLAGNRATDRRVFQVPEASGYLIPPFEAEAPALNFGGQARGWAKSQEELLRFLLAGAGSIPPVIGVAGAVLVEDPASTRISRRLRQADIDPDFAIASFARTGPGGPALVYRGDTIGPGFTASATYLSGPPLSASIANVYTGSTDGGDVDLGAWTINSPFAAASAVGSTLRNGDDVGPDPILTVTLTATNGFVRTASWTVIWTSPVYWGTSPLTIVDGTADVFDGGLLGDFSDSLQRTRVMTVFVNPVLAYAYVLFPDEAQYTSGTPQFKDSLTGFAIPFSQVATTTITRGVVRTYQEWRSDNLLNTPFTVVVT